MIHRLPCGGRLCRSRDMALPHAGAVPFRFRMRRAPEYGFRAHGLRRVSHSPASSPHQYSRNAFVRNAAMLARPNGSIAGRACNSLPNCEKPIPRKTIFSGCSSHLPERVNTLLMRFAFALANVPITPNGVIVISADKGEKRTAI